MRALVLLSLLCSILPSRADAQLRVTYVDGVLACEEFARCESPTDCGDLEPNCEPLSTGEGVCTALESALLEPRCCAMDEDCGEVDGVSGICTVVLDEAGGQEGVGVCRYLGVFDLCLAEEREVSLGDVAACFDLELVSDASLAVRYQSGDCDEDGAPNSTDPCPCSSDDTCLPAVDEDAGKPALEAPRPGIAGGGGCSTGGEPGAVALALLALGLVARRRRLDRSMEG